MSKQAEEIASPLHFSTPLRRLLGRWAREGCVVSQFLIYQEEKESDERGYYIDCATHAGAIDFLDIDIDTEMLSYTPAGKSTAVSRDGLFTSSSRTSAKPAKVARMALMYPYLERTRHTDLEAFANRVKGYCTRGKGEYTIVHGEALREWYHERNYDLSVETPLTKSCMRQAERQPWLQLYVANPDVISLLTYTNPDGKLLARALIWTHPDGITFMDRIYGEDKHVPAFQAYAKEHGWWHRQFNTFEHAQNFVDPLGREAQIKLAFSGLDLMHDTYPYVDTFKYLWRDKQKLANYGDNNGIRGSYDIWVLNRPDGEPRTIPCAACGVRHRTGHIYYGRNEVAFCRECWNTIRCQTCGTSQRQDGKTMCSACETKYTCQKCQTYDIHTRNGLCPECEQRYRCQQCGRIDDHLTARRCPACHEVWAAVQARNKARKAALKQAEADSGGLIKRLREAQSLDDLIRLADQIGTAPNAPGVYVRELDEGIAEDETYYEVPEHDWFEANDYEEVEEEPWP